MPVIKVIAVGLPQNVRGLLWKHGAQNIDFGVHVLACLEDVVSHEVFGPNRLPLTESRKNSDIQAFARAMYLLVTEPFA